MLFALPDRAVGFNSSLMLWHAGQHSALYSCLVENFPAITHCVYKFDHYLEMMLLDRCQPAEGHDAYCCYLQDAAPNKILEYSAMIGGQCGGTGGESQEPDFDALTENCAVICFPLRPKPHEVRWKWIQKHWTGSGLE